MTEPTIQDINVEHAEEVTMEVVINTCKEFSRHTTEHLDMLIAKANELSFEV